MSSRVKSTMSPLAKQSFAHRYCPYDGERLLVDPKVDEEHPSCPVCGFVDYNNPRPCVAILILRNDKVLLARRAVEPAKGKWDIPGGFIEPGESAEETVVREALEETNLLVRVTGFLGSLPDVYGDRKWPTLNLCFTAEAKDGEPHPLSDVESLSWFALDQLPKDMAFTHQHQMLQWYRQKVGLNT